MTCFECKTELLEIEGGTVCPKCGVTQYGFITVPEFSHHQEPIYSTTTNTTYKRPNHFKKILAHYPNITVSESNKLCDRFAQLQRAFDQNRGKRRNMLPYRFVIYKLCELLGYTHHLPRIKISKSKTKLNQQTALWECMCKQLNWRIPIHNITTSSFQPVLFPLS